MSAYDEHEQAGTPDEAPFETTGEQDPTEAQAGEQRGALRTRQGREPEEQCRHRGTLGVGEFTAVQPNFSSAA